MFSTRCLLLVNCWVFASGFAYNKTTLERIHVLFRHGDRTIDTVSTYPKDPYVNATYYPYGRGQLTKAGRLTEYHLGEILRERYGDFLGDIYTPDLLRAYSTSYDRTKMSMQLVLAGLFPPKNTILDWKPNLNWQPIPYDVLPNTNHLLSYPFVYCPKYRKLYDENLKSKEGRQVLLKHRKLFQYISENTGLNVTSPYDIFVLYAGLVTEKEWGFTLPEWTKNVFPTSIKDAVIDYYKLSTATRDLRKLASGFLLKKIVSDTESCSKQKIFMYSAHDHTVCNLLNTLDVFFPHTPPYGACVIIEAHRLEQEVGVKIFYEDYTEVHPKLLKLPECDELCPWEKFVNLTSRYFPEKDTACED